MVKFFAKKHQKHVVRLLYPLDYGVPRGYKDGIARYQFWDKHHKHAVCLRRRQILYVTSLGVKFSYKEFLTWQPDWQIARRCE